MCTHVVRASVSTGFVCAKQSAGSAQREGGRGGGSLSDPRESSRFRNPKERRRSQVKGKEEREEISLPGAVSYRERQKEEEEGIALKAAVKSER